MLLFLDERFPDDATNTREQISDLDTRIVLRVDQSNIGQFTRQPLPRRSNVLRMGERSLCPLDLYRGQFLRGIVN